MSFKVIPMKKTALTMIMMMFTVPITADDSAFREIVEDEVETYMTEPCINTVIDEAPWMQQDTERVRENKRREAYLEERMPEELKRIQRENNDYARELLQEQLEEEIVQDLIDMLVRRRAGPDTRMDAYKKMSKACINSYLSR